MPLVRPNKPMKKKLWAIKNGTYWVVFAALVVIAGLLAVSSLPVPGNYRLYTVLSGSMSPAIRTGSLVAVRPAPAYKKGDIITFVSLDNPKETVTHRVFALKTAGGSTAYITKGDANSTADPAAVSPKAILGKTVLSVPLLGYPLGFAKTQLGFIVLIVIPAVLIIYNELLTVKKETVRLLKKRRKRKLTPKEELEEKIGKEIIAAEKAAKKLTK